MTTFFKSAFSTDEWMADRCKGGRNLAIHSAIQNRWQKTIASTVLIFAKLYYKQTQYVDVLSVPRTLVKCGPETKHAFSKLGLGSSNEINIFGTFSNFHLRYKI